MDLVDASALFDRPDGRRVAIVEPHYLRGLSDMIVQDELPLHFWLGERGSESGSGRVLRARRMAFDCATVIGARTARPPGDARIINVLLEALLDARKAAS